MRQTHCGRCLLLPSQNHPAFPAEIAHEKYVACRRFLNKFDTVYSLNYDLLLYWAIMQTEVGEPLSLEDDGFRTPNTKQEDYVTWDVQKTDAQDVFYLHETLHLYDAGKDLKKFTWVNTGT